MYKFDAVKVKNDLIQWIKDWFETNGKGCNAVIGLSGGKDSLWCMWYWALASRAATRRCACPALLSRASQAEVAILRLSP